MDARRRSINKYNAKKLFVTKASDNYTLETHTAEIYTPYATECRDLMWYNLMYILREPVSIFRIEKI